MRRFAAIVLVVAFAMPRMPAAAQDFDFEPPSDATNAALQASLHDLAERVLPVYQEDDPDRYLTNLAALQMAIGDPAAALDTRRKLRERLESEESNLPATARDGGSAANAGAVLRPGRAWAYDIYVEARAIEAAEAVSFASAYRQAFEQTSTGLGDLAAYELERWLVAPVGPRQEALQRELDERSGTTSISIEEALALVQAWFAFDAYRSFDGLVQPLLAEDTQRRYVTEAVAIPVAADSTIAATVVRPRGAADGGTLTTLLEVALDASARDAREAAAHGYASVLALARIAGEPKFRPRAPFETEGDDAWAVIAWIAQQPWSDGRVAMQGFGYGGFVAWSVAKRQPPALHAIATSDPMAPGIDVPSSSRIFLSSSYRWLHDVLAAPGDELGDARWREIDEDWYRSGRSYREFPTLPGRASAIFRSWLNHPSYDGFWRKWLPFEAELAKIEIPLLTLTGYYSAGQTAALHYFAEHRRHAPDADHALLIGPYDERSIERGPSSALRGLPLDAAARIDATDVRYAWFAHVLGGAERPAFLSAGVNYELAGADEWRHEPSLTALERNPLRLYLQASPDGAQHALVPNPSAAPMSLTETRDLRDRTDAAWRPPQELVLAEVEAREGARFVTEPFDEPVDLAGRLRGELDFTVNKYDVDLVLTLYELRSSGEYVKLFDPAYAFRASYARDRVHRRLLTAGVRQQLPFQSERMVGHRLQAGSRLLLTLGINQRADQQLNYGGAGDVSEQSIEDAGAPMRIRWHEGSYIEIPSQPIGQTSGPLDPQ
ncbi:MAG TPA: CocE/NonD family hydrolase [Gammaproteobacteria bacterium]|nr:CocE/NonD family hydrolase [Gammaproteobacteria bacterium]